MKSMASTPMTTATRGPLLRRVPAALALAASALLLPPTGARSPAAHALLEK